MAYTYPFCIRSSTETSLCCEGSLCIYYMVSSGIGHRHRTLNLMVSLHLSTDARMKHSLFEAADWPLSSAKCVLGLEENRGTISLAFGAPPGPREGLSPSKR
jgi:hypothetical protein